jgi:hypothetical protein
MAFATVIADPVSPRDQGMRALLWIAPLTAAWLCLNYRFPVLQASGVATTISRLSIHIAIALGLWLALERAELTPRQRLYTWLTLIVSFTLWLAVIWSTAINGVFRPGNLAPALPFARRKPEATSQSAGRDRNDVVAAGREAP